MGKTFLPCLAWKCKTVVGLRCCTRIYEAVRIGTGWGYSWVQIRRSTETRLYHILPNNTGTNVFYAGGGGHVTGYQEYQMIFSSCIFHTHWIVAIWLRRKCIESLRFERETSNDPTHARCLHIESQSRKISTQQRNKWQNQIHDSDVFTSLKGGISTVCARKAVLVSC